VFFSGEGGGQVLSQERVVKKTGDGGGKEKGKQKKLTKTPKYTDTLSRRKKVPAPFTTLGHEFPGVKKKRDDQVGGGKKKGRTKKKALWHNNHQA